MAYEDLEDEELDDNGYQCKDEDFFDEDLIFEPLDDEDPKELDLDSNR